PGQAPRNNETISTNNTTDGQQRSDCPPLVNGTCEEEYILETSVEDGCLIQRCVLKSMWNLMLQFFRSWVEKDNRPTQLQDVAYQPKA
ncbi:unnamed protein product, partial [Candidula unifasciata]